MACHQFGTMIFCRVAGTPRPRGPWNWLGHASSSSQQPMQWGIPYWAAWVLLCVHVLWVALTLLRHYGIAAQIFPECPGLAAWVDTNLGAILLRCDKSCGKDTTQWLSCPCGWALCGCYPDRAALSGWVNNSQHDTLGTGSVSQPGKGTESQWHMMTDLEESHVTSV